MGPIRRYCYRRSYRGRYYDIGPGRSIPVFFLGIFGDGLLAIADIRNVNLPLDWECRQERALKYLV